MPYIHVNVLLEGAGPTSSSYTTSAKYINSKCVVLEIITDTIACLKDQLSGILAGPVLRGSRMLDNNQGL